VTLPVSSVSSLAVVVLTLIMALKLRYSIIVTEAAGYIYM